MKHDEQLKDEENMLKKSSTSLWMKIALFAVPGLVLCACHSNPYDSNPGLLSPNPIQKTGTTPLMSIEADATASLVEGSSAQVKILGHVEAPGQPDLTFANKPAWMTYDPVSGMMTCTPPAGAGIDPQNPTHYSQEYQVTIELSSSLAPASVLTQKIVFTVYHPAQQMTVSGFNAQAQATEGQPLTMTINVQSPDFPNGPFQVSPTGYPAGLTVATTGSPNMFQLSYTPNYLVVTPSTSTSTCSDFLGTQHMCIYANWVLNVVDPRGTATAVQANWQILDARQNPIVSAPTTVDATGAMAAPPAPPGGPAGTLTTDFYVNAQDPNGEVIPTVTAGTVPFGTLAVTTVTSNSAPGTNPSQMAHLVWTGIPATTKGSQQPVSFSSCVYDNNQMQNQCVTTQVTVQF
jgi:hypothetical protein